MAVSDAFLGGVVGFWYDASPIGNFQTLSSGGTALTAYTTRSAYAGTSLYGLWSDLSGNSKNATQTVSGNRGAALNDPSGSWMKAGNIFADMTTTVGGSTTAFYLAIAFGTANYYGTIYSDQTSAISANGFRLYYNADGESASSATTPVVGFCANGKAYDGTNSEGRVYNNPNDQCWVSSGDVLFVNATISNVMVIEAWYDGTHLFLRKNRGATVQSVNTVTASAGSTTAYLNSNVGSDMGSSGLDIYAAFLTKNNVPSASVRDQIYAYLLDRATSGGARLMTGQSVAVSKGIMSPPAAGTVALTGQSVTVGRGVMTPAPAVVLTGQAATTGRGVLGVTSTVAMTGQAVTTSFGTVIPTWNMPLTGYALTSQQGVMSPPGTTSVVLVGQRATTSGGVLVPGTATSALVGRSVTVVQGAPVPATSVVVPGVGATTGAGTMTVFNGGWRQTPTTTNTWTATPTTQVPGWTSTTTLAPDPGWTNTTD